MNGIVPVEDFATLLGGAELDAHAAFAVVRWFAGASLVARGVFEVFEDACVSIGVSILILHAILTYKGEARAFIILRIPCIVEAVPKAVQRLDGGHDSTRCCPLHYLFRLRIHHVDDGAARRTRMLLIGLALGFVQAIFELIGQVVVAAVGIRSNAGTHERNHGIETQAQLKRGAGGLRVQSCRLELLLQRIRELVQRIVRAMDECLSMRSSECRVAGTRPE